MRTSRLQYILTWIALILMLVSTILFVVATWNSRITGAFSPAVIILLWIVISASGIYLFMLAVKKAHRLYIDEKRQLEELVKEKPSAKPGDYKANKGLDFTASAHKIVRRIPEDMAGEELGNTLLKNLARELEIMSGVFYSEKKGVFTAVATYAMSSFSEPFTFKSGEGLTGQVARDQQLTVMTRLPEGYLEVFSGLGKAPPAYLAIVPLVRKDRTIAVLECAGYRHKPGDIENMFKILARDLMEKLFPKLS